MKPRKPDSDNVTTGKIGVLLTNLGTPQAPTAKAVRRYLAEFLWDPRVIDYPRVLWWLILHGIILRIRPARSARAYRSVWTEEGSPLLFNLKHQSQALRKALAVDKRGIQVEIAMRYGRPSIASAIARFDAEGIDRVLVFPLYPQYSATTTASTFDSLAAAFAAQPKLPQLRLVNDYHREPGYIHALAESIRQSWRTHGRSDRLLLSFHGLPRRYVLEGDPYYAQCLATADLLAEELELGPHLWRVAFQSRVGREPWLKPYTDEVLETWAKEGVRSVEVVCPGFSADCLETLEEIDEQYRTLFLEAGGESFRYVPALNSGDAHVKALKTIILDHLEHW